YRLRVAQLPARAQKLLHLITVAGAPIPLGLVVRAAGLDAEDIVRQVSLLREGRFLSSSTRGPADTVEPYHDRVRTAVLGLIPEADQRALHETIAQAFERWHKRDPEALATHWAAAGRPELAAQYEMEAAQRAYEAFAFDRAVSLYRAAQKLGAGANAVSLRL